MAFIRSHRLANEKQQVGFSLVSAIFLLVIFTALGAIMLTVSGVQQTESTQDLQGSKAYQAAKAGIDWAAYLVLAPENANPATAPFSAQYVCAALTPPSLAGALAGFTLNVNCVRNDFIEAGNTISVYQITSIATFGVSPNPSFVSRQLTATINTCRATPNGAPCS